MSRSTARGAGSLHSPLAVSLIATAAIVLGSAPSLAAEACGWSQPQPTSPCASRQQSH